MRHNPTLGTADMVLANHCDRSQSITHLRPTTDLRVFVAEAEASAVAAEAALMALDTDEAEDAGFDEAVEAAATFATHMRSLLVHLRRLSRELTAASDAAESEIQACRAKVGEPSESSTELDRLRPVAVAAEKWAATRAGSVEELDAGKEILVALRRAHFAAAKAV